MTTPQHIMNGYLAIILTPESQKVLLNKFPPLYPKVFAHHITVAFKPTTEVYDQYKSYIGSLVTLSVYGYAHDEKCEAVVVKTDVLKNTESHITISTNGVAPVYSKTLLQKGFTTITEPFTLNAKFEWIQH